jgi:hypothetical protein
MRALSLLFLVAFLAVVGCDNTAPVKDKPDTGTPATPSAEPAPGGPATPGAPGTPTPGTPTPGAPK